MEVSATESNSRARRVGFTLIELLVVIAIIGILASLLLPALRKAKVKTYSRKALSNARQIAFGSPLYTDENDGDIVALALRHKRPSSSNRVGPAHYIWWQDLILPFIGDKEVFYAPKAILNRGSGIGMNHKELGYWWPDSGRPGRGPRLDGSEILKPGGTVLFADAAGMASSPSYNASPDTWKPRNKLIGSWLYRTPTNIRWYRGFNNTFGERVYGRYEGRATSMFVDGHAELLKPSQFGFQYPLGHAKALWDTR